LGKFFGFVWVLAFFILSCCCTPSYFNNNHLKPQVAFRHQRRGPVAVACMTIPQAGKEEQPMNNAAHNKR
jgi:hypothetical protein